MTDNMKYLLSKYNPQDLKTTWLKDEQQAFSGWDFSYIKDRWIESPLEWDYRAVINKYLQPSHTLLDMGTGGGEFLLTLSHPHTLTAVTEAWPPNIKLCKQKLVPLGIKVYAVNDDAKLPIEDHTFDIVINRHEAYNLREVSRVLKPGGLFITQQVGSHNCSRLEKIINTATTSNNTSFSLETELPTFKDHDFTIIQANQSYPELKFLDVGAVVYFAKIIEWSFPGFSVENNFNQLCKLQEELDKKGAITDLEHRFIIVAQNGYEL